MIQNGKSFRKRCKTVRNRKTRQAFVSIKRLWDQKIYAEKGRGGNKKLIAFIRLTVESPVECHKIFQSLKKHTITHFLGMTLAALAMKGKD